MEYSARQIVSLSDDCDLALGASRFWPRGGFTADAGCDRPGRQKPARGHCHVILASDAAAADHLCELLCALGHSSFPALH
jgi:hypothetical protein